MTIDTRPPQLPSAPVPPPPPTAFDPEAPRRQRMRTRRMPTAVRLAAFHTVIIAAVLAVVVFVLLHQFTLGLQSITQNSLSGELGAVSNALGTPSSKSPYDLARLYVSSHNLPAGDQLLVKIGRHPVLRSAGASTLEKNPQVQGWLANRPAGPRSQGMQVGGAPYDVQVQPLQVRDRIVGVAVAGTSLTTIVAQRHRVLAISLAEGAVAVFIGALSAYMVLRRVLRTVGRMTTAAEEIGDGHVERRLGDPGTGDEVSRLARTFDAMLDKIAAALDTQRRLLSDVSHQLRTPMTVARGHLEVLQRTGFDDQGAADETVALVLDELSRMSEMVNSLLLLGRSMEPGFLKEEPVDVRSLLAEVHDAATVLAPSRIWTMGAVADVVIAADSNKLRGALLNLVENAAKATVAGDQVMLSCTLQPWHEAVVLAVDDSGPGIPEHLRTTALERFGRLPGDHSPGSGLGLAIVDTVARAHGGWVELDRSVLGGARVAIALPDRRLWRLEPHR